MDSHKGLKTKAPTVLKGFNGIWESLFSSPVHLDSALSKLPPKTKSILAQILPQILLRPSSQAEALGVGVPLGEPWSLHSGKVSHWRPAQLMAERIYEMMTQGSLSVDPIREDFPTWMVSEWEAHWSQEVVLQLIDVLGREAPLSLRAKQQLGSKGLIAELNSIGKLPVRAEVSDLSPFGVRLSGYAPVLKTEVYQRGDFEIQDEGSQFMALFALWPEKFGPLLQETPGRVRKVKGPLSISSDEISGWSVVDACAGAGGKSLAIADAMRGKGRIFSYDTSDKKLQALRRRATRAGFNNIQSVTLQEGNEIESLQKFKSTADVVLVDAPCSGWGVLRRNPDIKWRQSRDVLARMPEIQYRLLSIYSELVAPGGRLVFGVCTFRPSETREVIQRFVQSHPQFQVKQGGYFGPGPCDGFFMQALVRSN